MSPGHEHADPCATPSQSRRLSVAGELVTTSPLVWLVRRYKYIVPILKYQHIILCYLYSSNNTLYFATYTRVSTHYTLLDCLYITLGCASDKLPSGLYLHLYSVHR